MAAPPCSDGSTVIRTTNSDSTGLESWTINPVGVYPNDGANGNSYNIIMNNARSGCSGNTYLSVYTDPSITLVGLYSQDDGSGR